MNEILGPLIVLGVLLIGSIIGFVLAPPTRFGKKELLYLVAALLVFVGLGALSLLIARVEGTRLFFITQVAFGLLGLLHFGLMYYFFSWPRRDPVLSEMDSFWPELCFTLMVGSLGGLLFTLHFWWWAPDYAGLFANTLLMFPLPFIILKTADKALQIPPPDYEHKWRFPASVVEDRTLKWDDPMKVFFHTGIGYSEDHKPLAKRCKMWVEPSEHETLGNAFRLGIREYNIDAGARSIKDLGFEQQSPSVWWMFFVKPVLWRPHTWFADRVLNADASLNHNKLREGDIIIAKRIMD